MVSLFASVAACYATLPTRAEVVQASPDEQPPVARLLWQTNAGGDDLHVVDYLSGTVVARVVVGSQPHGIAAPAGGEVVIVSVEADDAPAGELVWIDPATYHVTRRMPLCREPHALAVTPDGAWIYVPCRDGHYWVVDGHTGRVVERLDTGGRPHNTVVSPDGRFVYLSPLGGSERVFIIDVAASHSLASTIQFSASLRPSALAPSKGLFFQHVDGLNGFEVADLEARRVVARVEHSQPLRGWLIIPRLGRWSLSGFERCHGLAVRPGEDEVWSVCADRVTIHRIASPDFPEETSIDLPGEGYWITFSPEGDHALVALGDRGEVAVIEADSRQLIRLIPAGRSPKRNLVLPRRR